LLRPGLSVVVKIDTRASGGEALAAVEGNPLFGAAQANVGAPAD
jgi:hypothetical protein